jgi:hypothetical protein
MGARILELRATTSLAQLVRETPRFKTARFSRAGVRDSDGTDLLGMTTACACMASKNSGMIELGKMNVPHSTAPGAAGTLNDSDLAGIAANHTGWSRSLGASFSWVNIPEEHTIEARPRARPATGFCWIVSYESHHIGSAEIIQNRTAVEGYVRPRVTSTQIKHRRRRGGEVLDVTIVTSDRSALYRHRAAAHSVDGCPAERETAALVIDRHLAVENRPACYSEIFAAVGSAGTGYSRTYVKYRGMIDRIHEGIIAKLDTYSEAMDYRPLEYGLSGFNQQPNRLGRGAGSYEI